MQPDGSAIIICFPQSHNVGKARHVAGVYLRRRTEKSRETYWADTCETLAGMLRRRGFDEDEIELQIEGFRRAVSDELGRVDRQRPGGAA